MFDNIMKIVAIIVAVITILLCLSYLCIVVAWLINVAIECMR